MRMAAVEIDTTQMARPGPGGTADPSSLGFNGSPVPALHKALSRDTGSRGPSENVRFLYHREVNNHRLTTTAVVRPTHAAWLPTIVENGGEEENVMVSKETPR